MNAPFSIDRPDVVHEAICEVLASVFPTVDRETLLSGHRVNHCISWVRQTGMYLMCARFHITQAVTGQYFGRDRTTVLYAVQLASQEVEARPRTAAFMDFLQAQVLAELDRRAAVEAEWGMV